MTVMAGLYPGREFLSIVQQNLQVALTYQKFLGSIFIPLIERNG
jgi:hypothetical protein